MNEQYLTITESAILVGKSSATIRRLINQMDNHLINQMIKREGEGSKAKILIKRSFLEQKFLTKDPIPQTQSGAINDNAVDIILREQLAIKDRQIDTLNGQISDLIRSKEHSDILLKNMQTVLLALPQPQSNEPKKEPPKRLRLAFWQWVILILVVGILAGFTLSKLT